MANQGENRKGKIISASPVTNNNGHATYQNNRGDTMYKFFLTWDNGDSGEASAKSANKQYKLNVDLTYVKYTREHNGNKYYSFASINDPNYKSNAGGGGGGYKKKSPEEEKIITNQVVLIGFNSCMNVLKAEDNEGREVAINPGTIYLQFRDWMYNKMFNLKEDPQTLGGVFKIACTNLGNKGDKVLPQEVLTLAEKMLSAVKNVTWNNPTQSPQQSNSQQSYQEQPQMPPQETHQEQPSQQQEESQQEPPNPFSVG